MIGSELAEDLFVLGEIATVGPVGVSEETACRILGSKRPRNDCLRPRRLPEWQSRRMILVHMTNRSNRLILGIAILSWAWFIFRVGGNIDNYMWDFQEYYYAARANAEGLDYFRVPDPNSCFGRWSNDPILHYPYFPPSVFVFEPFTNLPPRAAKYLFLAIKAFVLIYLFCLWQFVFLENPSDPFFAIFCLVAFNLSLFLDIRAGNINMVEQGLIWSAFFFFVRGKLIVFCFLIAAAAMFKLTPLLFLGLLVLSNIRFQRRSVLVLILAVATVTIPFAIWLLDPEMLHRFLSTALYLASGNECKLKYNPTLLSLIKYLATKYSAFTGTPLPLTVQVCPYIAAVMIIVSLSWKSIRNLNMLKMEERKTAVYLACLVYALVLPRFQDYQWIILLVPTYALMLKLGSFRAYPVCFGFLVFLILFNPDVTILRADVFREVLFNYQQLAVALIVWLLYLRQIGGSGAVCSPSDRASYRVV
jgi:hypothetical protein